MYYPVRHHLLQHMVNSIQRVGFTPTATLEHKKLAVDLAEVIIKWELQRIKDEQEQNEVDFVFLSLALSKPQFILLFLT